MTPEEFLSKLRAYCARFNASATSSGRTALHNEALGGVPGSAHLVWLAADVVYDTFVPEGARELMAHRLGLRLIVEDDHDHLGPADWGQ